MKNIIFPNWRFSFPYLHTRKICSLVCLLENGSLLQYLVLQTYCWKWIRRECLFSSTLNSNEHPRSSSQKDGAAGDLPTLHDLLQRAWNLIESDRNDIGSPAFQWPIISNKKVRLPQFSYFVCLLAIRTEQDHVLAMTTEQSSRVYITTVQSAVFNAE